MIEREVVRDALGKLDAHFEHAAMDAPGHYSKFLFDQAADDAEEEERLRLEAVAVVGAFFAGLGRTDDVMSGAVRRPQAVLHLQ